MTEIERSGWGRNASIRANVRDVSDFSLDEERYMYGNGLPIGLGRSYGDSSLNSGGCSWSCNSLKSIEIDPQMKTALCGSGVTIGELERRALTLGLFPKVVPGTEFVSIGGAIASNIHGKSNQEFGSFGDNVTEITVLDSRGMVHVLEPRGPTSSLFWATVGGMGLTGLIISAKVELMSIETTYVSTQESRVYSFKELLQEMEEFDAKYQYTVAWIDLSRPYRARGIVSGANLVRRSDLPRRQAASPLATYSRHMFSLPRFIPNRIISSLSVKVFNLLWFYKPLKRGIRHVVPFLHPLDSISDWNRLYGHRGFLQYQILVPFGQEILLDSVMEELQSIGAYSPLTVLKKLDSKSSSYLSFPGRGWTLAIDLKIENDSLLRILDKLDKQVCATGGRVYLAKDSRLARETFQKMYPNYGDWLEIKKMMDPQNYWQSDQGRRLGLC